MDRTSDKIGNNSSNKNTAKHCECDAISFAKALAQLLGPDLPFKLTQDGEKTQTFTVSETGAMSKTCGLKQWSALCGALKFKFTMSVSNQEIAEFSYIGLDW